MNKAEHSAWKQFEHTGSIKAYLEYKAQEKNELNFEAGEDFGVDKNVSNSDKGN